MKRNMIAAVHAGILCVTAACSTPPAVDPRSPGADATPFDFEERRVTVLGGSMSVLRDDFNAHADRWRLVLVVSPTCNECVLGARAVEREIMARYPADRIHASVVWIPMLAGDNEIAAHHASRIIARENATHFFDTVHAVGSAYDRGPFAEMDSRVAATLPASGPLQAAWRKRGEDRPQWDLYMLYAPGVRWSDRESAPPTPESWIRHLGRHGGEGALSSYWRDTLDSPPLQGDLYVAMRTMAEDKMGPARDATRPPTSN